ncbi:MAG: hypothetical protein Sylvanvirus11_5 [Sylvanvirus sp.]|uniref:Uncharacterized protein n=1 Tax=Sylvanvirus sp. TaxID=2487774 RepID=A0A3G5AHZ6_9VIRU|nr:MAG: hypothetical protein Sylvanvirus11_5 [Sylvanvirus sp.]
MSRGARKRAHWMRVNKYKIYCLDYLRQHPLHDSMNDKWIMYNHWIGHGGEDIVFLDTPPYAGDLDPFKWDRSRTSAFWARISDLKVEL